MTPNDLLPVIQDLWSEETCASEWNPDLPCHGQGAVTALAIHDLCGGQIVKTECPSGWHYYNLVDGERYDLTKDQFNEELGYSDDPVERAEVIGAAGEKHYLALKAKLKEMMG